LTITGDADRFDHRDGNDDYVQPRALFKFDAGQKSRLFLTSPTGSRACRTLSSRANSAISRRCNPEYAAGVRAALAAKAAWRYRSERDWWRWRN